MKWDAYPPAAIFSESSVNWSGERLVSVPAWSPEMWTGNLTLFGDQFGKGDKVERSTVENMTPQCAAY